MGWLSHFAIGNKRFWQQVTPWSCPCFGCNFVCFFVAGELLKFSSMKFWTLIDLSQGKQLILFHPRISMFHERKLMETLRFDGIKINCFPRDQSIRDLFYCQTKTLQPTLADHATFRSRTDYNMPRDNVLANGIACVGHRGKTSTHARNSWKIDY